MPRARIHQQIIAIGAVLTALSLAGVQAASAETEVFKDILRPHGVSRTTAQKDADAPICGADRNGQFDDVPAFERCMRAHGWAVASIKPDAEDRAIGGAFYDDMTGRSRSEAALQSDTRACDPQGRLKEGGPQFARCMARHGWRLAFSLPVRHAPTYAGSPSSGPSSSAQAQTEEDNFWEAQRNEDAARQMQQSIDATNAANAAAAQAAADAATQQNNIIQSTCNYSC